MRFRFGAVGEKQILSTSPSQRRFRLFAVALMLAAPACGDSVSTTPDAAVGRDGPVSSPDVRDGALPDAGPGDSARADVPSPDAPMGLDGGPAVDAPLVLDAGSVDVRDVPAMDTAQDRGVDGPPGTPVDATPMDSSVDTGPSFCAVQGGVDAGGSQRLCYDFSDTASAASFVPEAGTWTVSNGYYSVVAPPEQVTCSAGDGSLMIASVLSNFSARDIRVHAKMTAIRSPDKVIVLRSRSAGRDRIELNFRSNFVFEDVAQGGDLYISALVNCEQVTYVPVGTILIPHAIGQAIVADVQLVGRRLTVAVDGRTVFDDTLPIAYDGGPTSFPTEPGTAGFAAFRDGITRFDDFLVDVLD